MDYDHLDTLLKYLEREDYLWTSGFLMENNT